MNRQSLHIGLNSLDPHVWGAPNRLGGCENDATDMAAVARACRFTPQTLLTAEATRDNVWRHLINASAALAAGDYFFLTYSGHGGQVRNDPNNPNDANDAESDGLDETWCLYDGQLLDDMLYVALTKFKRGVRVFVMSDSCHSGTVTRDTAVLATTPTDPTAKPMPEGTTAKALPFEVTQREFEAHKPAYERSPDWDTFRKPRPPANASVILISGCRDDQTSKDLGSNGAMTAAFLRIWNNGSYSRNFNHLVGLLQEELKPYEQKPDIFPYGDDVNAMVGQVPLRDTSARYD